MGYFRTTLYNSDCCGSRTYRWFGARTQWCCRKRGGGQSFEGAAYGRRRFERGRTITFSAASHILVRRPPAFATGTPSFESRPEACCWYHREECQERKTDGA